MYSYNLKTIYIVDNFLEKCVLLTGTILKHIVPINILKNVYYHNYLLGVTIIL